MTDFSFTDRYQALGMDYPDPGTMCKGQCEGTGWVPIFMDPGDKGVSKVQPLVEENDPRYVALWQEAHAKPHGEPCDGWHFIKCPDCGGSGKVMQ